MSSLREQHQSWFESSPNTGVLIEDFTSVSSSLIWRAGAAYWRTRGTQAFLQDSVPFGVTSDGYLGASTAEVLLASCAEAEARGELEDRIEVLELAVGMGLHARTFLSAFARGCAARETDWFERLTLYVTDVSQTMLADIERLGIFAGFEEQVCLALCDVREPSRLVTEDGERRVENLRMVRANYLLSLLDFELLRVLPSGSIRALQTSTWALDPEGLRRLGVEPTSIGQLLQDAPEQLPPDLIHRLGSESAWVEVDPAGMPGWSALSGFLADAVIPWAVERESPTPVIRTVHSHGAIQAIAAIVRLLRPDGLFLFSDYGWLTLDAAAEVTELQQFGGSTAMGLNFPLLEYTLDHGKAENTSMLVPPGDTVASIHSRCLMRTHRENVTDAFASAFAGERLAAYTQEFAEVRRLRDQAEPDVVLGAFEAAHQRWPESWLMLGEYAQYAIFKGGDPARGLALVETALAMNPTGSPMLLNDRGDALFLLERYDEAREAFETAVELHPENPRSWVNLAWTLATLGDVDQALAHACRSMLLDKQAVHGTTALGLVTNIINWRRENAGLEPVRDLNGGING